MSHSAENFRKEILLFLRQILFSKSFMDEKGGITVFCRKFLASQSQKLRGHPFSVSENLGYRKNFCIIGVSQVPSKIFCLTVPKIP